VFPWFWFWAPQLHFPFSGDVRQRIDPDTNWFFGSIAPSAGHGRVEQQLFATASYGKQLGRVTEALLAVCDELPVKDAAGRRAVERLRSLATQLEEAKTQAYASEMHDLLAQLQWLQAQRPEQFAELAQGLKPALPGAGRPRR
jgi:hypothetical protein